MSSPPRKVGPNVVSSFTVSKGLLVEETYAAFTGWDTGATQDENLDQLRESNWIGARSRSWLRDIAFALRRRFDTDGRDRPLVLLAQRGCPLSVWTPLLLWHGTRDEFLLRDFLQSWLFARHEKGVFRLRTSDVVPYLDGLSNHPDAVLGKEEWSEKTKSDVGSALLRSAADVGLLVGKVVREFVPYRLPDPSLLYLLHAVAEREPNARNLLDAPDWRMYLMAAADVEREVLRLHQHRALDFQAAGSLAQLRLPAPSLAAFAQQMTW